MGNPHIVTFLDQNLSDEDFFKFGPKLENHSYFPLKTNVEFVKKITNNHFQVRVWERGVGETLSCGSGACAVGAAAFQKNLANGEVKISFKGGDIFISLNKNGEIIMKGGVTTIFYGMIPGL
jgi:diaminopimelate epimerase